MNRLFVAVGVLSLVAVAGCDESKNDHPDMKTVRAAEVRGEAAHCLQCLNEAVSRSAPFAGRMQAIEDHGTWLFEEGPLSMNLQYRNRWFECKRVVPELIEPAKAVARSLRSQLAELDPDSTLTRAEAAKVRKIIYRGNELANDIATAVHLRNVTLVTRLEPALRRYPMPPLDRRLHLPPDEPESLLFLRPGSPKDGGK